MLPFNSPAQPTDPAAQMPVPAASVTQLPAAAPPDRRAHWLAYDPSSRSQYPVD